jgi:nucleoside-diphosphate-sugar epimerase
MHTAEMQEQVNALKTAHGDLATFQVPELSTMMDCSSQNTFAYPDCSDHLDETETLLILHSSGTTGLPKPIPISVGAIAVLNRIVEMPVPEGRRSVHTELLAPTAMVSCMPAFHVMGIGMLARSIYHRGILVTLPSGSLVTAELIISAIEKTKPSSIICPPSILEDICLLPNGIQALSSLDYVFYGGAPLARGSGDKISSVATLQSCIGSTETLHAPCYLPLDRNDWDCFEWNEVSGAVMEEKGDGLFELVIEQRPDRSYQPVFYNFPDLREWRTKDLFRRHPTKDGLWRYAGRLDDLLVLSNGEKFMPGSFERHVESHPWVNGALMIGTGRFQTSLIIEPRAEQADMDPEAFLEETWPWVEHANALCPGYARVWRSMVVVAASTKPFARSAKGSVRRRATVDLYAVEVDQMYKQSEEVADSEELVDGYSVDFDTLANIIGRLVRSKLPGSRQIDDNANFFSSGLDSLMVLQLSTKINQSFQPKLPHSIACSPAFIYRNPSVSRLTRALIDQFGHGHHLAAEDNLLSSREERMSVMIHKYTANLPRRQEAIPILHSRAKSVLVTGTTGALGSYLLHHFVSDSRVDRVYCLNRDINAASKQKKSFLDRGLDPSGIDFKAQFLTGNFERERFVLSPEDYLSLQDSVDTIVLNAWPVDFNHDLEYFEAGPIAGTRRWVDFATSARYNPRILFLSSIASVGNWPAVRRGIDDAVTLVPEVFDTDNSLPSKNGYGESKHVASAILSSACVTSGVKATIVRTGQLGGPQVGTGVWNKSGMNKRHLNNLHQLTRATEWFPSLIATSKSLGKIPSSFGDWDLLDWVPIDAAAKSISELALACHDGSPALDCVNLVNPQNADWKILVNGICGFYREQGCNITPVPFSDWVDELKQLEVTPENVERHPGLKLTEFYDGLSKSGRSFSYATGHITELSQTIAQLPAVSQELISAWLRAWDFS